MTTFGDDRVLLHQTHSGNDTNGRQSPHSKTVAPKLTRLVSAPTSDGMREGMACAGSAVPSSDASRTGALNSVSRALSRRVSPMRGRARRPASASCSAREPRSWRGSRARDLYLSHADSLTVRRLSCGTDPVFQFQNRPFPYTDSNADVRWDARRNGLHRQYRTFERRQPDRQL